MEDSESNLRFFYESEKLRPHVSQRNKPIGSKIFDLYENPAENYKLKSILVIYIKNKNLQTFRLGAAIHFYSIKKRMYPVLCSLLKFAPMKSIPYFSFVVKFSVLQLLYLVL